MNLRTISSAILGVVIGAGIGVGAFTFIYARGYSYLTNDPQACVNCHVMRPQFDGWVKSSHRAVATCNDCHTPHDLLGKYITKARNGFWHSFYFTTGTFHEPIAITRINHRITEGACRHCHATMAATVDGVHDDANILSCTRCHPDVGHWTH